jgi:hypothetical protein
MAEPKTYDPEATYDLRVSRPVTVDSFKYLPRDDIVATGKLILQLIEEHGEDVIRSAVAR